MKLKKIFRKIDLIFIVITALTWSVLDHSISLIGFTGNVILVSVISLFITAVFISFVALAVSKYGAITVFYILAAIFTIPLSNFGGPGLHKISILIIAGIVFDVVFFVLRGSLRIPLATAFSNASMPWVIWFMLLSSGATVELSFILNSTIMDFLMGILGALAGMFIWYKIRTTKLIVKFECLRD